MMTDNQRQTRLEATVQRLASQSAAADKRLTAQGAATDKRLDRLAVQVNAYVKASTEWQKEIMTLVEQHDRMIRRFDDWLRGQGPKNGQERK